MCFQLQNIKGINLEKLLLQRPRADDQTKEAADTFEKDEMRTAKKKKKSDMKNSCENRTETHNVSDSGLRVARVRKIVFHIALFGLNDINEFFFPSSSSSSSSSHFLYGKQT